MENIEAYFQTLQTTMQAAVTEAERLRDEALADLSAAADQRMETQALLNRLETEASHAAEDKARAWLKALREATPI